MSPRRAGRWTPPILLSSLTVVVGSYLLLRFAIRPPIPGSVLGMYLFFIVAAQLLYVSADEERFESFKRPLLDLVVADSRRVPRGILGLLLPLLAGYWAWLGAATQVSPPPQQRSVHPAPPNRIDFKGKSIDVLTVENPFRELEQEDPGAFREHVARGKDVYYRNCFFCHGDNLDGEGPFAHAFAPLPADLADPGTIAQLQESYLFWRIAKGGPGLPVEATPWDSAMPAWEKFLEEDQIWEVILFLYDFTGARPRAWE